MSHRIVRRAGIAGITVAGLLLTGSGVASATVLPYPASGGTATSITTTAYADCVSTFELGNWSCCYTHRKYVYRPPRLIQPDDEPHRWNDEPLIIAPCLPLWIR